MAVVWFSSNVRYWFKVGKLTYLLKESLMYLKQIYVQFWFLVLSPPKGPLDSSWYMITWIIDFDHVFSLSSYVACLMLQCFIPLQRCGTAGSPRLRGKQICGEECSKRTMRVDTEMEEETVDNSVSRIVLRDRPIWSSILEGLRLKFVWWWRWPEVVDLFDLLTYFLVHRRCHTTKYSPAFPQYYAQWPFRGAVIGYWV